MKKLILLVLVVLLGACSDKESEADFASKLYGNWRTDQNDSEVHFITFKSDGTYVWHMEVDGEEFGRETGTWSCTEKTLTASPEGEETQTINYRMPDDNTLILAEEMTYYRI